LNRLFWNLVTSSGHRYPPGYICIFAKTRFVSRAGAKGLRQQNQENTLLERIEWHFTQKHGSWLNIAEIELSALKRQCLRSRLPDIETVRRKVTAWQARRNCEPAKID